MDGVCCLQHRHLPQSIRETRISISAEPLWFQAVQVRLATDLARLSGVKSLSQDRGCWHYGASIRNRQSQFGCEEIRFPVEILNSAFQHDHGEFLPDFGQFLVGWNMLLVCRAEPALQFVARWACLGKKNWVTDFSVSVLKCSMLIGPPWWWKWWGQYVQKEILCQEIYVYLKMFFCRPHTKSPSSGERRVACEKRLKSSQSEVAESLLSTKKKKAQCLLFRQLCSNIYS